MQFNEDDRAVPRWWTVHRGDSPVLATAIHAGHGLDPEIEAGMALGPAERLREEDPFTDALIEDVPSQIICHRSRFEVDLNRARGEAIYLEPRQAWGLEVRRAPPSEVLRARILRLHDGYYAMLRELLRDLERDFGQFVLLDVHSYNHRRDGAHAPPASEETMPEINIGTFSMDRERWAHVVDPLVAAMRGQGFDVRENVAFQGRGEQTRFVHSAFPANGCAIAVEFKKTFMDEWTGEPDPAAVARLRALVCGTVPLLEAALRAGPPLRARAAAARPPR